MSDAPPNWAQEDASQPDYIANKDLAEKLRPISVNGEEFLDDSHESGGLNFVGGKNISLTTDGNSIIISAKGATSEGGSTCDCPELVEGEGLDITDNAYGKRIISLEPGAITDKHISQISMSKIIQDNSIKLILNGGNANG